MMTMILIITILKIIIIVLETSALKSLYGGQVTLSTQLIKPNYFD